MRQAFAAFMAFLILIGIVVARFGFKASQPAAQPPIVDDAGIEDAPTDAAPVVLDAGVIAKKPTPKPAPKRPVPKPAPKPKPKPVSPPPVEPLVLIPPTPPTPPPVITPPVRPRCTQPPNPAGCPATQPNVNRPCDAEGVHCVYGTSCCPPVYVCNNGAFEAWFTSCP